MGATNIVSIVLLGMLAAAQPAPVSRSAPETRPAKTFPELLTEAAKAIDSGTVSMQARRALLERLSAAAKADDIPLLVEKLKETSEDGSPSTQAHLAGALLGRLSARHGEALDAILRAARAGNAPALSGIGQMNPEQARKAALALWAADVAPGTRATCAGLLAIVGRKEDVPLLEDLLHKKPPDSLAVAVREAIGELQYKLENVRTDQFPQWEAAALAYWSVIRTPRHVGPHSGVSVWQLVSPTAMPKGHEAPIELLRYRIGRREPLAIALAGSQKQEELIPDLEKVASGSGEIAWLAKSSMAKIGTEEAVNACLRVTGIPEETPYRHMALARWAAKNGGPTTLPILRSLAEDKRFTDYARKQYADAAERLAQRLDAAGRRGHHPTH